MIMAEITLYGLCSDEKDLQCDEIMYLLIRTSCKTVIFIPNTMSSLNLLLIILYSEVQAVPSSMIFPGNVSFLR